MVSYFRFFLSVIFTFGYPLTVKASQLYLQPSKTEYGFFTNDSFFLTCFTTDDTIDQLTWTGVGENEITATEGRVHIQPASGLQQGLELVVESVQKQDAGRYVCSDVHDSIYFDLTVYNSISFSNTERNQHTAENENATITCHVKSDLKPVVNWYFDGNKLTNSDKYRIGDNALTVVNTSRNDAGSYKCEAFVVTTLGSQIRNIEIIFDVHYSPEFSEDMKTETYAMAGSSANLTCLATGSPYPKFQWLQNGEMIHNDTDYIIYDAKNESVLQINANDKSNFGEYICRASNVRGWVEEVLYLKEGEIPPAPVLSVISEDQSELTLGLKFTGKSDVEVTGFQVEYIMASETWDQSKTVNFDKGEPYVLKNMSYNTAYIFRAASINTIGHGNYSSEVHYSTQSLQVAPVVADIAVNNKVSPILLLIVFYVCLLF